MKRQTLLEAARERVILLDGAMGTMLFEKGLRQGEAPEQWNVSHPERVGAVHKAYLDAGAEAVLTNTFGGSSIKLGDSGLGEQATEFNRAAVDIARSACGENGFVIGDIGPTGKILAPYGDLSEADLRSALKEQVLALVEAGVDALVVETQMDLREAVIGLQTAKALSDLPIIASFTFNLSKRGYFTLMGNSVRDAMREAEKAGADIVGTNCSLDSRQMRGLLAQIADETTLPIYAKANAGQPELIDGKVTYAQSVDDYLTDIPDYLDIGVRLIGGCCGTNPDYIAAMRRLLKS